MAQGSKPEVGQETVVLATVLSFITKLTSECPWMLAFLLTQDDLLGPIELSMFYSSRPESEAESWFLI